MKISIPTNEIQVDYVDGANNVTPEPRVTIDNWIVSGRIKPQIPSVINDNALFQDGDTVYEVNKESLNDINGNDGIIFENPMVWEADVAILNLEMPTSIPAGRIPTGGVDAFENINKQTEIGTSTRNVGEWFDSLCTVYRNDILGKIQIYTSPVNARFIEYHLVRAFALEFTVANHPELTEDTEFIVLSDALASRESDLINWLPIQ